MFSLDRSGNVDDTIFLWQKVFIFSDPFQRINVNSIPWDESGMSLLIIYWADVLPPQKSHSTDSTVL